MPQEYLARKAKEQQQKLHELKNKITESRPENPVETMKSMNVSDEIIQQVQIKIETDARDKVREIIGGANYETYD